MLEVHRLRASLSQRAPQTYIYNPEQSYQDTTMVQKGEVFSQLFSKQVANVVPDQLSNSAAAESQGLVSHVVNSPNANILSVFVQIRQTIARIPNGLGEALLHTLGRTAPDTARYFAALV